MSQSDQEPSQQGDDVAATNINEEDGKDNNRQSIVGNQ
jgi:hypothetical protein